MKQSIYKSFGPDAEVLGQAMLAFVHSINFDNFEQILEQHGLSQIDPNRWYPQQIWLDVFNDIAATRNASSDLISIGMKIIESIDMPPELNNLPFVEILRGFGEASYVTNNRGKHIGYISAEVVNDHHVIMHDATPYPDDFVYGAYYAMARRFLPRGSNFKVTFDANIPRREQGGKETLLHVTWS